MLTSIYYWMACQRMLSSSGWNGLWDLGLFSPNLTRCCPTCHNKEQCSELILSFALCYLDYLLIITLAVEFCPCVHTANPASIRLPCVSLPRGGGSCSVSEGPGKGSSIADPKTAFPAWFPSFLPAVHLTLLLMLDPSPLLAPTRLITAVSSRVPFHLEPNFL